LAGARDAGHLSVSPEGATNAKVAVEVAQLARRVAAEQEVPQDI
jgi:hypothetical protein